MTMSNEDVAHQVSERLSESFAALCPQPIHDGQLLRNRPTPDMRRHALQVREVIHSPRHPNLSLIVDLLKQHIYKHVEEITRLSDSHLAALWIESPRESEIGWASHASESGISISVSTVHSETDKYYLIRCDLVLDLRDKKDTQFKVL